MVNGTIYAVGGFDGTSALSVVEAYDPGTDQWSTKTAMPGGVVAPAAAAIGGTLYVIGGFDGASVTATTGYDPSTAAWTAQAAMPTAREGVAAAVIDSMLYAVGGESEAGTSSVTYLNANEVFSPAGTADVHPAAQRRPFSVPPGSSLSRNAP